jgi:hypothetical protein
MLKARLYDYEIKKKETGKSKYRKTLNLKLDGVIK